MKIIERRTVELIPYEKNQKKHDEKQIRNVANSIKKFGWQQPIVIDKKDVVVIGHCRLLAAQMLGLETVPVTIADNLSAKEIKELRIADNKTNESAWDMENLNLEIGSLDFDGFEFDFGVDMSTAFEVEDYDDDDDSYDDDDTDEQEEEKEKGYSITYELSFNDEEEQSEWYKFLGMLKRTYKDYSTISERVLHVAREWMSENE